MPTTQIADIYDPTAFATGAQEEQIELNKFIQSGVITADPRVAGFAQSGGTLNEIAFIKPLGTEEPNYSNDDPDDKSTTAKISGAAMAVRTAFQNKSWSVMDLAQELALAKPMEGITGRIGQYWATSNERRIIASCVGILADNVANDGSDMLVDVSLATGAPTDANKVSANSIIDAVQTMGDHGENLRAMGMHSAVYRALQKQNLIEYIPNSRGEIVMSAYQGKQVIVDDSIAPDTSGDNPVYTVILFTEGAFVGGEGMPLNASELWRDPDAGNGGGEEKVYSRRTDIAHPLGFSCVGTPASGSTLSLAELRLAATWDRVWERKNTGIAFLKVNA